MTITISLLGAILMLMVLSTILEHISNWAFRSLKDDDVVAFVYASIFYIIKWFVLITILKDVLR